MCNVPHRKTHSKGTRSRISNAISFICILFITKSWVCISTSVSLKARDRLTVSRTERDGQGLRGLCVCLEFESKRYLVTVIVDGSLHFKFSSVNNSHIPVVDEQISMSVCVIGDPTKHLLGRLVTSSLGGVFDLADNVHTLENVTKDDLWFSIVVNMRSTWLYHDLYSRDDRPTRR